MCSTPVTVCLYVNRKKLVVRLFFGGGHWIDWIEYGGEKMLSMSQARAHYSSSKVQGIYRHMWPPITSSHSSVLWSHSNQRMQEQSLGSYIKSDVLLGLWKFPTLKKCCALLPLCRLRLMKSINQLILRLLLFLPYYHLACILLFVVAL